MTAGNVRRSNDKAKVGTQKVIRRQAGSEKKTRRRRRQRDGEEKTRRPGALLDLRAPIYGGLVVDK